MRNKSESILNLAKALVEFNKEVKIIEKDAQNPHFRNQYASLDNIVDEVRPILAKHGLVAMQFPGGDGEQFTLRTMIVHESGEWIESDSLSMKPVKNDPQGIGSCTTYARRYSLSAMLSLNTGDDDDGNDASQPKGGQQQQGQASSNGGNQNGSTSSGEPMATEPQANMLYKKMTAAGLKLNRLSEFLGYEIKNTREVHRNDVNKLIKFMDENAVPM